MNDHWREIFHRRMMQFEKNHFMDKGTPVSIKIRVGTGCFHREHSPQAYKIIDQYLESLEEENIDFSFEEHESGPEILVFLAVTTAGITLAKSIIDLITVIIKARTEGIKKGDSPSAPIKLIIRRSRSDSKVTEEEVMHFETNDPVDEIEIEETLTTAVKNLLEDK